QVEINLKLFNSQNTIDEFLNKVVEYKNDYKFKIYAYGISQNPDTKDYILVLQNGYCERCGEKYKKIWNKWCNPCQIKNLKENFRNWTSGNEKIDNFIQEIQLKVNHSYGVIFEWISYNQFSDIKKIGNTIYSALWNDGQLKYDQNKKEWTRVQVEINLKLFNSQNTIDEFLNKVVEYKNDDNVKIYGMSQYPDTNDYILVLKTECNCEECGEKYTEISYKWCNPCQIKNLKENFRNWTSGNEQIDNFIQEIQLKVNHSYDIIFEWISYDQFSDIKKIGNIIYSALWNDGRLEYDQNKKEWTRVQVEINLKLFNSQNTIDEFLNKKIGNTIYSALWKDGLLKYNLNKKERERIRFKEVILKLCNSQYMIGEFLNKIKVYENDKIIEIYGISQDSDTKDYIMVLQKEKYDERYCEKCIEKYTEIEYKWCKPCQITYLKDNFKNWTSKNEIIDNFIQEMQLKINNPKDLVFEWISYDQFNYIKEINKNVYSALWKDGPLKYNLGEKKWERVQVKEATLKLCNSQNMINAFLNKVVEYKGDENFEIYGISQNPDTKDYVLVSQGGYCEKCDEKYTEIQNRWLEMKKLIILFKKCN
ncbi:hypothetical protein RhiirA4_476253, partial [Rhizophagus irregularis]